MAIRVGGVDVPAQPDPSAPGWFEAETPLGHGDDYELLLDGVPVPDLLSRWLPDGVHGLSRWWDPATVPWTDSAWTGRDLAHGACVYELHVGTFTPDGTFDAAVTRLPHLVELGVTHVELLPVAGFDGVRGWGYDGVALASTHVDYGGPDALARFVDAAHSHGVAVLLDVVLNHLGPSGDYSRCYGPMLTEAHHTPWGPAMNLDAPGSDDVRRLLVDVVLDRIRDFHLDGVRLDAVHELHDDRAIHFLEELTSAVNDLAVQVGRPLSVIAESDRNDPRTVRPAPTGLGCSAVWNDDVHHALHWLLTGESEGYYGDFATEAAVERTLMRGFLHDGRWSSFRGRSHGRPIDFQATPARQYVVALQTHDQVGNRAQGERLVTLAGLDRAAAGAALLMSLPYTPMLFMGEEWGASSPWQFFTSYTDPQLAAAVRQGRRREFAEHSWSDEVPDPQDVRTFMASRLSWPERLIDRHADLLAWYRRLLCLRRDGLGQSALANGPAPQVPGLLVQVSSDLVEIVSPGWRTCWARGPRTVGVPLEPGDRPAASWGTADHDDEALRLPSGACVVLRRGR